METMKEGGGTASGGPRRKNRRPTGVTSNALKALLLRLHTYTRDFAEQMKTEDFDLSAYEALAMLVFELAELFKMEYDNLHG